VNDSAKFTLVPDQASMQAPWIDHLSLFVIAISVFFSVVMVFLLVYFGIRYRRRAEDELANPTHVEHGITLETVWSLALLALFLFIFFWSADVYFAMNRPPENANEIYVVGRQWMWKIQHPEGQREINQLTLPVGEPVRVVITSEDVIHSFFIPAFRNKMDAVPGRYTFMWFTPSRIGEYHIFCAQYCGTEHSRMIGTVRVLSREDYQAWLSGPRADLSMATRGRQLFLKHQCIACHAGDTTARAPSLEDLYKREVTLDDGRKVIADENYIRESIRLPRAKIVAGWKPIMPQFDPPDSPNDPRDNRMSEAELQDIVAFIKTLKKGATPTRNERTPAPDAKPEETKPTTSGSSQP
jgi:cytochrome c oxidase subunit II